MNEELLKSIDRSLKAILGIVASIRNDNPIALNEQVARLHNLGFQPKDIGVILGRTGTYVSKELSLLRKNKTSKGKKNG